MSNRPQNKNLIPLTERSEEEAHAIRSAGGKAAQAKRQQTTQQNYLLGKMAGLPIVDKRTVKKFERMGYSDDEITKALEITDAIFKGAKAGDPRMIDIYLRIMGEDVAEPVAKENNLLDAILNSTKEDVDTDDLPELQQTAESDADLVE